PDPGPAIPIGIQVAIRVAPDAARHRRPRLRADELPDLAGRHGPAVRPPHADVHPEGGATERARLQLVDRKWREEARADLRPAGEVDDREPAAADGAEQPLVRIRVPRLAR